jgi:hypothetical protein
MIGDYRILEISQNTEMYYANECVMLQYIMNIDIETERAIYLTNCLPMHTRIFRKRDILPS